MKVAGWGEDSTHIAISFNALGGAYLHLNRLDAAETASENAYGIRETQGPRLNAADSRENLGALT